MQRRGKDLRIGDPEREGAIALLGEHLTAGRLDVHEYDQRCSRIAAARFSSEIQDVFADLPAPVPVAPPPQAGTRPSSPSSGNVVLALGLGVGVVLLAVVAKQIWILALLGLAALMWFGRRGGSR